MAQAIVSQEQVYALADQLVAAGEKPTMTRVREMIGGSYSTIKTYLDSWKQEWQLPAPPSDLSPELTAKGEELLRSVWQIATSLADQQIAQVRAETQRQVLEARADVQQLETALTQQEREQAAQAQRLAEQTAQIQQLEALRAELQLALHTADLCCPYCDGPLTAKKGQIIGHHFAHTHRARYDHLGSILFK